MIAIPVGVNSALGVDAEFLADFGRHASNEITLIMSPERCCAFAHSPTAVEIPPLLSGGKSRVRCNILLTPFPQMDAPHWVEGQGLEPK